MSFWNVAPRTVLRWVVILTFSIWFGGFTFYGAVVLPVLHDQLDQLAAGSITREVAYVLNLIGLVSIGLMWLDFAFEMSRHKKIVRRFTVSLLILISLIQLGLLWGHSYLGRWLDEYGLRGFYRIHTIYLHSSTVQWAANILLLGCLVVSWSLNDQLVLNKDSHDDSEAIETADHLSD